jgi:hypothetical protein
MGGIMGAQEPFKADTYIKIIEDAEKKGCTYCNIAFSRETLVPDINKFSEELMPSYT